MASRVLQLHQALYERTDGRIGHRVLGVPTLLLRTTGRRSGQTRTNALAYVMDGGRWIVVASNGGAPVAPAWLLNLRADPRAEVQVGRVRRAAKADIIEADDPDYARLWRLANSANKDRFDAYQVKTTRRIPVVALDPAVGGAVAAAGVGDQREPGAALDT